MQALETTPLSARFSVADPGTGRECGVDILKEIFWRPVAQSPNGPVLAEDHVIGTKARAPADRGTPRDPIDVFAASQRWTNTELEEFSRRHARGRFEREGLQANLTGAEWTDDEAFTASDATRPWATAPPSSTNYSPRTTPPRLPVSHRAWSPIGGAGQDVTRSCVRAQPTSADFPAQAVTVSVD